MSPRYSLPTSSWSSFPTASILKASEPRSPKCRPHSKKAANCSRRKRMRSSMQSQMAIRSRSKSFGQGHWPSASALSLPERRCAAIPQCFSNSKTARFAASETTIASNRGSRTRSVLDFLKCLPSLLHDPRWRSPFSGCSISRHKLRNPRANRLFQLHRNPGFPSWSNSSPRKAARAVLQPT